MSDTESHGRKHKPKRHGRRSHRKTDGGDKSVSDRSYYTAKTARTAKTSTSAYSALNSEDYYDATEQPVTAAVLQGDEDGQQYYLSTGTDKIQLTLNEKERKRAQSKGFEPIPGELAWPIRAYSAVLGQYYSHDQEHQGRLESAGQRGLEPYDVTLYTTEKRKLESSLADLRGNIEAAFTAAGMTVPDVESILPTYGTQHVHTDFAANYTPEIDPLIDKKGKRKATGPQ